MRGENTHFQDQLILILVTHVKRIDHSNCNHSDLFIIYFILCIYLFIVLKIDISSPELH